MDVNVLPSIDKGSFLSFPTTSEQHLPVISVTTHLSNTFMQIC